jgi:uncharacterized phage protein gp47/JayE
LPENKRGKHLSLMISAGTGWYSTGIATDTPATVSISERKNLRVRLVNAVQRVMAGGA